MKNVFAVITVALLASVQLAAQQGRGSLTIEECYGAAERNYPLVRQYGLINKARDYTLSNAARAYLPQVTLSAKAGWQSDVTKFSIDDEKYSQTPYAAMISAEDLNGLFPTISKDQYGAALEVTQTIWDGGVVKAQRTAAKAEAQAQESELDASLYGLREKINELYFGIILLDANLEQYGTLISRLETNLERLESYKNNGVVGQADVDALKIHLLDARQQISELSGSRAAFVKMLSLLTGLEIEPGCTLQRPSAIESFAEENTRPELAAFDAQIRQIDAQNELISASLTPKFGLYATGGYGRPGLNMLDNSFRPYFMGGVRMSWNIGNFYNAKSNRQLLETKKASAESRRDAFLLNTGLDSSRRSGEIETLRELMQYDDEIIALRESLLRANEANIAEGTISGSELSGFMDDLLRARQVKNTHEVKLLMAMYNLAYVRGEK